MYVYCIQSAVRLRASHSLNSTKSIYEQFPRRKRVSSLFTLLAGTHKHARASATTVAARGWSPPLFYCRRPLSETQASWNYLAILRRPSNPGIALTVANYRGIAIAAWCTNCSPAGACRDFGSCGLLLHQRPRRRLRDRQEIYLSVELSDIVLSFAVSRPHNRPWRFYDSYRIREVRGSSKLVGIQHDNQHLFIDKGYWMTYLVAHSKA